MRKLLILGPITLATAIVVACSTFEAANGEATDAGVDAPTTTTADATVDGSFCASQGDAAFCDDFDHEGGIELRWNGLEAIGTASPSADFDPFHFSSPPNGAKFIAEAAPDGAAAVGSRLYRSAFAAAPVGCDLEWQPLAFSNVTNDSASVASLTLVPNGAPSGVRVELHVEVKNDGAVLWYVNDTSDAGLGASAAFQRILAKPGTWMHVHIGVTASDFEMTVEGESSGPRAHTLAAPITTTLYVGAYRYNPLPTSAGWTFVFDNVVCR